MGLCKCLKKKVTNQFCFEHRVNVCEDCMIESHPKCIVRSYLQWLNASDYNPVCQLCQEDLVSAECVRLVCYDVFHRTCLNDWASKLPSNTAPDGYRCPVCSSGIFPASNLVSPVADVLRNLLRSCEWARAGLGMPILKSGTNYNEINGKSDSSSEQLIGTHNNVQSDRGIPDGRDTTSAIPNQTEQFQNTLVSSSQHRNSAGALLTKTRNYSDSSSVYINSEEDTGENKYKRRPALEWFARWIRTFQRPSSRHHQGLLGGKRRMSFLLTVVTVCIIIVLLSYLGRGVTNDDPMLDPFNNPNIRVEENM